jgi:hypothetical protein
VSGCEIAGGKVEWMIRRILRGFETASRRGAEKGTPTSKTLQTHNGRKHLSLYHSLTLHPPPQPGLYTDESPGLKVDPVVVLVLSLGFIFSVVALHSESFPFSLLLPCSLLHSPPSVPSDTRRGWNGMRKWL